MKKLLAICLLFLSSCSTTMTLKDCASYCDSQNRYIGEYTLYRDGNVTCMYQKEEKSSCSKEVK